MKVFKSGVIVGRFQHIHIGHEKLINIGLSLCEKLVIFVGSAQEENTIRNPFDIDVRMSILNEVLKEYVLNGQVAIYTLDDLTNEKDLTPKWGKYVLKKFESIQNCTPNCIIYGKDKDIRKCFLEEDTNSITEIYVDRKSLEISATDIRKMLIDGDESSWKRYVNPKIYHRYNELRDIIVNIKNK
ncbi:MAG: adenylyltransferase/cytidyltransferase family protein [Clostridia bacterium]|nr:adenylyltransferase/cytidyltransferase family protein [Clostridia bacterium]